jgi:putative exporter of polyketide antibiotics
MAMWPVLSMRPVPRNQSLGEVMIWYLALLLLLVYARIMITLAPRWDREAPSDLETLGGEGP